MEYSRNTLTISLRRHEIDMLEEAPKSVPTVQPICVATWAGAGLLVGAFWFGVFSIAWKLVA